MSLFVTRVPDRLHLSRLGGTRAGMITLIVVGDLLRGSSRMEMTEKRDKTKSVLTNSIVTGLSYPMLYKTLIDLQPK